MKYLVQEHLLGGFAGDDSEQKVILPGTEVTEQDLADAGYKNLDFLLNPAAHGKIGFPPKIIPILATKGMTDITPAVQATLDKEAAQRAKDEQKAKDDKAAADKAAADAAAANASQQSSSQQSGS